MTFFSQFNPTVSAELFTTATPDGRASPILDIDARINTLEASIKQVANGPVNYEILLPKDCPITKPQRDRVECFNLKLQLYRYCPQKYEEMEQVLQSYPQLLSPFFLKTVIKAPFVQLTALRELLAHTALFIGERGLQNLDVPSKQKILFLLTKNFLRYAPSLPSAIDYQYSLHAACQSVHTLFNDIILRSRSVNLLEEMAFILTYLPPNWKDLDALLCQYYYHHLNQNKMNVDYQIFKDHPPESLDIFLLAPRTNFPPLPYTHASCRFPNIVKDMSLNELVYLIQCFSRIPENHRLPLYLWNQQLRSHRLNTLSLDEEKQQPIELLVSFFDSDDEEIFDSKQKILESFFPHCSNEYTTYYLFKFASQIDIREFAHLFDLKQSLTKLTQRASPKDICFRPNAFEKIIKELAMAAADGTHPLELLHYFLCFGNNDSKLVKKIASMLRSPAEKLFLQRLEAILGYPDIDSFPAATCGLFQVFSNFNTAHKQKILERIASYLHRLKFAKTDELQARFDTVLSFTDAEWNNSGAPILKKLHDAFDPLDLPPSSNRLINSCLRALAMLKIVPEERRSEIDLQNLYHFVSRIDWLYPSFMAHLSTTLPWQRMNLFLKQGAELLLSNKDDPYITKKIAVLAFPDAEKDDNTSFAFNIEPMKDRWRNNWQQKMHDDRYMEEEDFDNNEEYIEDLKQEIDLLKDFAQIILKSIPPQQRSHSVQEIKALLEGEQGGGEMLFSLLNLLPVERQTFVYLQLLSSMFISSKSLNMFHGFYPENSLIDEAVQWHEVDTYLHFILLFNPTSFPLLLREYRSHPNLCNKTMEEVLLHMMSKNDIREPSLEYLERTFSDLTIPIESINSLADFILHHSPLLLLSDDDPFYAITLQVYLQTLPNDSSRAKNAYLIYKRQKEQAERGELSPFTLQPNGPEIWNLEKLRKKEKAKIYSEADLPQNVDSSTLEHLINAFGNRFNALDEDKQRLLVQRFVNLVNLEELIGNLSNATVTQLMRQKEPTELKVYLYRILTAILEQPQTIGSGGLSPREEMLLHFADFIPNCATTKKEGITLYYDSILDVKYKIDKVESDSSPMAAAEAFVRRKIQKSINQLFISDDWLKRFTDITTLGEPTHQALYFKNEFGYQVGLYHTVTVDFYITVVLDQLIEMTPQQFLEHFFAVFTPNYLYPMLCESLTHGDFVALNSCFKHEENVSNYFEEVVENGQEIYRLTKEGAKTLLRATHFLTR